MKYMKIGILPDTFYTQEASRTVQSDVPGDLTIQVNNTRYLLHKFPLLRKCGLLQQICPDNDHSGETAPVLLHDLPGGEEAFELCAKFCYGIAIKLSARNFVPIICAAKFLRMTESVSKGNFTKKLESFFNMSILEGWKDSIIVLQTTRKLLERSENYDIIQQCKDSIIQKILTPHQKVTWSYTYTRQGYDRKQHKSAPKDWWTEDVSDLHLEIFQAIILYLKSAKQLPAPLIGEALHVYTSKHLDDQADITALNNNGACTKEKAHKQKQIVESIASMIPNEHGSVSGSFLLRLLKVGNYVGASPNIMAELIRRSAYQLHEAKALDLLFPSPSNPKSYDTDIILAVLEVFMSQFRRSAQGQDSQSMMTAMHTVARIIDYHLLLLAHSSDLPVTKIVEVAQFLPDMARPSHDSLYYAIDMYLKEHPQLSKAEKKQLCQIIDCRRLSGEARSHVIRNENIPLRTVIQVLFIAQEEAGCGQTLLQAHPEESFVISIPPGRISANRSMTERVDQGHQQFQRTERKPSKIEKSRPKPETKATTAKVRDMNIKEGQGSNSKHK